MRSELLIVCALALTSCAGAEKWINASPEDVQIEGVPYRVMWVRNGANIDTRVFRNEALVIMPDALTEKRRSLEAATQAATRLCGAPAIQTGETMDGALWSVSFVCKS